MAGQAEAAPSRLSGWAYPLGAGSPGEALCSPPNPSRLAEEPLEPTGDGEARSRGRTQPCGRISRAPNPCCPSGAPGPEQFVHEAQLRERQVLLSVVHGCLKVSRTP